MASPSFATIDEFYKKFAFDENKLIDLLILRKLLPGEVKCGNCRNMLKLNRATLHFNCGNEKGERRKCNWSVTARKGTFFENSKLSLTDIMKFVAFWCKLPYPKVQLLMDNVKISKSTCLDLCSFCREVCMCYLSKHSTNIGGKGVIVEVDEAKCGQRKSNRGQICEGQWVMAGIEMESNRVFLNPVMKRDMSTILSVIEENILPGTSITGDFWKANEWLEDAGFEQFKVKHSVNFVDPKEKIERQWRDVQGGVPRYGKSTPHFVGHLAEFLFKRKFAGSLRIGAFLDAIAEVYPLPT